MKISSEWTLLSNLKKKINTRGLPIPEDLIASIGDDCAVFETGGDMLGLITTDISIEKRHFLKSASPYDVGFKAMMGNISDIAAMCGKPRFAFISIGLPSETEDEYVESLYDGMIDAANDAHVILAGGDISKSDDIVLNIALYGEVHKDKAVFRRGAKPGDHIYITGHVGDSAAGLEMILSGETNISEKQKTLIDEHLRPIARHALTDEIHATFSPTAMIDVSDGLLSDLNHICEMSRCGFTLDWKMIPTTEPFRRFCMERGKDIFRTAATSGEEYELIFTSAKDVTEKMELFISGVPVTKIGVITKEGFSIIKNGEREDISINGFDHFKE